MKVEDALKLWERTLRKPSAKRSQTYTNSDL